MGSARNSPSLLRSGLCEVKWRPPFRQSLRCELGVVVGRGVGYGKEEQNKALIESQGQSGVASCLATLPVPVCDACSVERGKMSARLPQRPPCIQKRLSL